MLSNSFEYEHPFIKHFEIIKSIINYKNYEKNQFIKNSINKLKIKL